VLEFAEWLQTTPVSVVIQSTTWAIPLLQSIHILMIGVVFVSILMVVLRVLGRVRTEETLGAVWTRFAPWMWSALVVMALTGLTLVIGEPVREFTALSFWLKMGLIAIGVASVLLFRRSLTPALLAAPQGPEFSAATKSAAILTLVLWLAIIFLGRAIAYDSAVWGSLSLSS
jgi:uncharacterized membrane protein SirB2